MHKIILKRNSVHLLFIIVLTVALYHTLRRIGLHFSILSRIIPTLSHPLLLADSYIYDVLGLFVIYYCVTEFWCLIFCALF